MKFHFTCMLILLYAVSYTQVGIGTMTPDTSALIDISSNSKGILIPRMTTASVGSMQHPAKALMVYDTIKNELMVNMGTDSLPDWKTIAYNSSWNLSGNTGTNSTNHFIGTTDNKSINFRVNNKAAGKIDSLTRNTYIGYRAGGPYGGSYNTAIGFKSLHSLTNGSSNVAVGVHSLYSNTLGLSNTGSGAWSLYNNTIGNYNTATGSTALYYNTTGYQNSAFGASALQSNITGHSNVAVGLNAIESNTTGTNNVGVGKDAISFSSTGSFNSALGNHALRENHSGSYNAAVGDNALTLNQNGYGNSALGASALFKTSTNYNTGVGFHAGNNFYLGWNNTLIGAECNTTVSSLYNTVGLGQGVAITANSQARIGNSSTVSIGGYTSWTNISDGRYKKDIQENVKGIDFIMRLRPVTYHLDVTALRTKLNEPSEHLKESGMETAIAEKESMVFSGFIAQEVEQASHDLGYDFSGVDKPKNESDLYGLRYAEFVVPLVKAMQEQQMEIRDLRKENEEWRLRVERLEARMGVD